MKDIYDNDLAMKFFAMLNKCIEQCSQNGKGQEADELYNIKENISSQECRFYSNYDDCINE